MKILIFGGGLGNQLFGYAFTEYLRLRHPNQKVYGLYNKKLLSEHHGLELERWFYVNLPKSTWWTSGIVYILYILKKMMRWTRLLDLDQYVIRNENALVYFAQHADKQYVPEGNWLQFKIDNSRLNNKNRDVLYKIQNTNSIFLHVRRGDYLSPKYKDRFEGCCTIEYYKAAIEYINQRVKEPNYFVFSNDIEWTCKNIHISNATYIDWNHGQDSPLDMFLMSQCKHGIIANSTFSWWGAVLGEKKGIITYPEKWVNYPFKSGDIFYDNWIRL